MATAVIVEPTGDDYIDGLIRGKKWSGQITYSTYPESENVGSATPEQLAATSAILNGRFRFPEEGQISLKDKYNGYNNVASFASIAISEHFINGDNGEGNITVGIRKNDSTLVGEASSVGYPVFDTDDYDKAGVWFGTALNGTDHDVRYPVNGNFAYALLLKLLGQTLGLKPSGVGGGVSDVAVPADRDSLEYTVMSARAYVNGPSNRFADVGLHDFPQTYMPLDILALQALYGAYYGVNRVDTVYRWSAKDGQLFINGVKQGAPPTGGKIFMTVWDGGGNDTYDMWNFTTPVSIDLTPGGSSVTSQAQRAYLGDGVYARGNVYNAYLFEDNPASLIENAISGSGNDTLRGNFADNVLNGGGGADTMTGLAGNDGYVVDHLGDVVIEAPSEGTDTVYVRATGYVLPTNVEQAKVEEGFADIEVWGNADANLMAGNDLANTIHGGTGADVFYGMAGADILDGGAGPDQMIGGLGSDTYIVDHLSDVVFEKPGEGTDTLWTSVNRGLDADFENIVLFGSATDAGGNGKSNIVAGNALNNNLYGGGGSDSLYGHDGIDRLFGEDGNDYMTGGRGTDAYYGGAGYDYAILEEGGGVDYFVDWNVTRDRVVFDSAIFSSIGAAIDAAFQNGTDVVIWDGSDGIVLQNAKLANLSTSNFLIV